MADVLTTFPHVNLPEKLAFMYLMHLTTRWQASPNDSSYARMPVWLRPTVTQITVPHAAWIDNIPWPRVRDILIQKPDRYPFAVFSELYSEHVSINWPYDPEDIVVDTGEGPSLNTIFEKHIQRLSNWIAPRPFREYFSEWTSDVLLMMSGSMKAAQYNTTSNKVEINEIPIPEPGENDILIKNACASLCHSDLMLFWGHTAEKPPMEKVTIGHENTGTVAAIGRNVTGFKIGDPVGCLGCSYACLNGNRHFLPLQQLTESSDLAAYHSVKKCGLNEGDWITIIGCGGLGHLAIQYAKALKLRVIGIDISDSQLESAKSLGADLTFNSASTLGYEKEILSQTDGGAHAAVVLSASNAAYQSAPSVLRINGILMVIGIPKENLSINALHILLGKYRIMGASSGTPQQMREPIEFSHKHGIKAHMTTFNDIEDIQKIIDLLENGKTAGRFGIVF
ncbi:Polyketide synthase, enoylreductase [Penicillium expansum]|nr:Polyketide synthase, enoylreductase [Penicillium expansum]